MVGLFSHVADTLSLWRLKTEISTETSAKHKQYFSHQLNKWSKWGRYPIARVTLPTYPASLRNRVTSPFAPFAKLIADGYSQPPPSAL